MASQSLSTVSTAALKVIDEGGDKLSVQDIVRAELAARAAAQLAETPKPVSDRLPEVKPDAFTVSDEERKALNAVLDLIGALPKDLPLQPGVLTNEQRTSLVALFLAEKDGKSVLERVQDAIRTLVLNDETIRVEQSKDGVPEGTARDKNGYVIPADKVYYSVPGETGRLAIEPQKPSVLFDGAALVRLQRLGKAEDAKVAADPTYTPRFTHKQFLKVTEQVRVWDDDAALKEIAADPAVTAVFAEVASTKVGQVKLAKR